MRINYNNKRFKAIENSENGEISESLIFTYRQDRNLISCNYSGETILQGQLLGTINDKGILHFSYQQINSRGQLKTGTCISTPEILSNGKIRLHEKWQWTNGDKSKGESILEEL